MHLHAFPVGILSSMEVPRLAVRIVPEYTGGRGFDAGRLPDVV